MQETFAEALEARTRDILDNCTSCGRCFEVCPMTAPAGIGAADSSATVSGVLRVLQGGSGTPEAERWAEVCSGSGTCIPACPENVNPRFMLSLARVAIQKRATSEAQHRRGSADFSAMGRGVRVLSRMQLAPDVLKRFRSEAPRDTPPELVFYTGCNVLKTPHIVLLALDILDALGTSYQVMGGPGDCCGVLQYRTGDVVASGRIAYRTTDRFAATGASKVLAWCPTCTVQLGENVLPGREGSSQPGSYDMEAFVVYLAGQLERLKAVPGLEYVELEQPQVGYMCNTLRPLPEYKRQLHRGLLEGAAAAHVDALAGVYHACHRELCSHETDWPFEVVNFLELIGESMGFHREDHFKRLKMMQDADAILTDVMDLVEEHNLGLEEVRAVIAKDLLGEQPLPLRNGKPAGAESAPG